MNALSNSKPKDMQPTRRPFLWYEAQTNYVYEWGGWPYDDNTDYWLWSFQPDGKGSSAWSQNPAPASLGRTLSAPFGSASASSPTAFYALGGAFVPDFTDVNTAMAGLVSYNFSSNSWSNTSSSDFSDTSYSVLAESSFVPTFGMEGLLTFVGGSIPSNQTYLYNLKADLTSMETVAIYDLQSGHWYHQTTTGDIPPVRTKFCSVGAAAPDNSSYEM